LHATSLIDFNLTDIAPNYASILMGISNTIGSIPGIVSPIITGYIVTDQADAGQWKWIFIIAAILYLTGAISFWFMSTGTVQPWAQAQPEESNLKTQPIDSLESKEKDLDN